MDACAPLSFFKLQTYDESLHALSPKWIVMFRYVLSNLQTFKNSSTVGLVPKWGTEVITCKFGAVWYQSTQFGANECKTHRSHCFHRYHRYHYLGHIYLTYLHRSLLSKDCRYGPGSTNVQWIDSVSSRASGYWWCIIMRHQWWVS